MSFDDPFGPSDDVAIAVAAQLRLWADHRRYPDARPDPSLATDDDAAAARLTAQFGHDGTDLRDVLTVVTASSLRPPHPLALHPALRLLGGAYEAFVARMADPSGPGVVAFDAKAAEEPQITAAADALTLRPAAVAWGLSAVAQARRWLRTLRLRDGALQYAALPQAHLEGAPAEADDQEEEEEEEEDNEAPPHRCTPALTTTLVMDLAASMGSKVGPLAPLLGTTSAVCAALLGGLRRAASSAELSLVDGKLIALVGGDSAAAFPFAVAQLCLDLVGLTAAGVQFTGTAAAALVAAATAAKERQLIAAAVSDAQRASLQERFASRPGGHGQPKPFEYECGLSLCAQGPQLGEASSSACDALHAAAAFAAGVGCAVATVPKAKAAFAARRDGLKAALDASVAEQGSAWVRRHPERLALWEHVVTCAARVEVREQAALGDHQAARNARRRRKRARAAQQAGGATLWDAVGLDEGEGAEADAPVSAREAAERGRADYQRHIDDAAGSATDSDDSGGEYEDMDEEATWESLPPLEAARARAQRRMRGVSHVHSTALDQCGWLQLCGPSTPGGLAKRVGQARLGELLPVFGEGLKLEGLRAKEALLSDLAAVLGAVPAFSIDVALDVVVPDAAWPAEPAGGLPLAGWLDTAVTQCRTDSFAAFFGVAQELVTTMTTCPAQALRAAADGVLAQFLRCLAERPRLVLLAALIALCPHSGAATVLVVALKTHVDVEAALATRTLAEVRREVAAPGWGAVQPGVLSSSSLPMVRRLRSLHGAHRSLLLGPAPLRLLAALCCRWGSSAHQVASKAEPLIAAVNAMRALVAGDARAGWPAAAPKAFDARIDAAVGAVAAVLTGGPGVARGDDGLPSSAAVADVDAAVAAVTAGVVRPAAMGRGDDSDGPVPAASIAGAVLATVVPALRSRLEAAPGARTGLGAMGPAEAFGLETAVDGLEGQLSRLLPT